MSTSMSGATGPISAKNATGTIAPKGYKVGQINNWTPEMQQLFSQTMGHVSPDSFTSKLAAGDEGLFSQLEAPALRQFQGLLGQTAGRFGAGAGEGHGFGRSSGFQNTLGSQSQEFAEKLMANRLGLQKNAIKELFGMSSDLLRQRPYEQVLIKKPPPFWISLAGGLGEMGGLLPGAYAQSQGLEKKDSGQGGGGMDAAKMAQIAMLFL